MSNWPDEGIKEPLLADHRNYYKVEKWTKDGGRIERMLYAGSNLDKAREIFTAAIKHWPRIRLTIRQRTRMCGQLERKALGEGLPTGASQPVKVDVRLTAVANLTPVKARSTQLFHDKTKNPGRTGERPGLRRLSQA